MKVWIDQDLYTGDGLCLEIVPDVFVMDSDGLTDGTFPPQPAEMGSLQPGSRKLENMWYAPRDSNPEPANQGSDALPLELESLLVRSRFTRNVFPASSEWPGEPLRFGGRGVSRHPQPPTSRPTDSFSGAPWLRCMHRPVRHGRSFTCIEPHYPEDPQTPGSSRRRPLCVTETCRAVFNNLPRPRGRVGGI